MTPSSQTVNLQAFRSKRNVLTIQADGKRYKTCQVIFHTDGSFFVNFPYFRQRIGILSATTLPAHMSPNLQVTLLPAASSLHTQSSTRTTQMGAHFSQDGKVYTAIKRQSVPLDQEDGHIFSIMIQGLEGFDRADDKKDQEVSTSRAVLTFDLGETAVEAIKLVGRWKRISGLQYVGDVPPDVGPLIYGERSDGTIVTGTFLASPFGSPSHALYVSCERIARFSPDPELLIFIGGFDQKAVALDLTKESGMLAFMYPTSNPDDLARTIGSIDFKPVT